MPAAAYQPPAPTPKDTAWCNNITHMRIAAPRHCLCRSESSLPSLVALGRHGCAFVTVAGAAISASATAVSITESAVETTADVAAAGVDAVVGEGDEEDMDDED